MHKVNISSSNPKGYLNGLIWVLSGLLDQENYKKVILDLIVVPEHKIKLKANDVCKKMNIDRMNQFIQKYRDHISKIIWHEAIRHEYICGMQYIIDSGCEIKKVKPSQFQFKYNVDQLKILFKGQQIKEANLMREVMREVLTIFVHEIKIEIGQTNNKSIFI
jgi:hypothetical protein